MEFQNSDSGTSLRTKPTDGEDYQPVPFRNAFFRVTAPPKFFTHHAFPPFLPNSS
jgi:hypothetical protein